MARGFWEAFGRSLLRSLSASVRRSSSEKPAAEPRRDEPRRDRRRAEPALLERPRRDVDEAGSRGGDATGDVSRTELPRIRISYAPDLDGDPDPGEIIWTWVPYAENDGRGKDRPVLVIGRLDARTVVGCYLSTKPHRGFVSVGTGAWDGQGRESFLSPERLLRISHSGMRREGHVLPRDRFERAVAAVVRAHGLAV